MGCVVFKGEREGGQVEGMQVFFFIWELRVGITGGLEVDMV